MDNKINKETFLPQAMEFLTEIRNGVVDDKMLSNFFLHMLVGNRVTNIYSGVRIRATGEVLCHEWSMFFAKEKVEITEDLLESSERFLVSANKALNLLSNATVSRVIYSTIDEFNTIFTKYIQSKIATQIDAGHQQSLKSEPTVMLSDGN
jgi:hypothetical protein